MALRQKTVAPFSEHKGGVGSFLKNPRSNSVMATKVNVFLFTFNNMLLETLNKMRQVYQR